MQIQLKQTEIIAALKQYISAQGINLAGKEVSISFTAGRKESGIIADLSIDDAAIPGFSDADVAVDAAAPALRVVAAAAAPEPAAETEQPQAAAPAQAETADAEQKPKSLFN
jgi:hypothetical protein